MRAGKTAEQRGVIGSIVFQVDRECDLRPWLLSDGPGTGWTLSFLWFTLSWVPGDAVA
jgi:hypothetical protein